MVGGRLVMSFLWTSHIPNAVLAVAPLVAAAIPALVGLMGGLFQQKANEEQQKRQMMLQAAQQEGESKIRAEENLARGTQGAYDSILKNLRAAYGV